MTFDGTNLTLANDLIVGRKVKHNGDENNYIEFTTDDMDFNIDSKSFMRFTEVGSSDDKIVFNEGSNNIDFRIESDDDANMFVMDAGLNKIGVGTASPSEKLDVRGNILIGTNNQYLQFVNAAGTQFDAIGYDASNDLVINTPSDIIFKRNGTENIRINSSC